MEIKAEKAKSKRKLLSNVADNLVTKSGRVSKIPIKESKLECVMGWAAIEKCRNKKKKQIYNRNVHANKKEKEIRKKKAKFKKKSLNKKKFPNMN